MAAKTAPALASPSKPYRPKSSLDVSLRGAHAKGAMPKVGRRVKMTVVGKVTRHSMNDYGDGDGASSSLGLDVHHVAHEPAPARKSLGDLIAARQHKAGCL